MQLQKQIRKQFRPRTKVLNLRSFNPIMKPGFEIASVTVGGNGPLGNMYGPTHIQVTTQARASA